MPETIRGRSTILATGGAAALWSRTTNPWGAIGAGPVMAHAAGADSPTSSSASSTRPRWPRRNRATTALLVTEAVRGEGATLLDAPASASRTSSRRATRSRWRCSTEWSVDGTDHVLLDMRELSETRFPSVFKALRKAGHDPAGSRSRSHLPPTT